MKIHEYYRNLANINLNGSIAALFPTILIIGGNLSFFQNEQIMLLTIPFFLYSLSMFHMSLFRMRHSLTIEEKMRTKRRLYPSFFNARHLLVVFLNTQTPQLQLYSPDGHLAGMIKKWKGKGKSFFLPGKNYALYDSTGNMLGLFKVRGRKSIVIEVFDRTEKYVGCYEKKKTQWGKSRKELLDANGRYIGTINGSSLFMDEQIYNHGNQQVGRLRRGWMPVEWSQIFPEPNTPVLTFTGILSENDKLLQMSFLINEYFIER